MFLMRITQLALILRSIILISQALKVPSAWRVTCYIAYMVIDDRRDHSIRVPRPYHTVKFETPISVISATRIRIQSGRLMQ